MKKSIIILGLLFLFVSGLKAQDKTFAPIGAEWYYSAIQFCNYQESEYIRFWVSKDTLVDGKMCRYIENDSERVVALQDSCYASVTVPPYILYEENQKIYNWYNGRFFLVFDFGVKVGDTLDLHIQPAWIDFYDSSVYPSELPDTMYLRSYIVEKIDSIYNGRYLKKFMMASKESPNSKYFYIERIGFSFDYIISRLSPRTTIPFPLYERIRCYYDDEISYVISRPLSGEEDCTWRSNVMINTSYDNVSKINIFPNPAKEFIHIQFTENIFQSGILVNIIDIWGKTMFKQKITSGETKLDISNLRSGTYFLKIQNSNQIFKSIKFIKL